MEAKLVKQLKGWSFVLEEDELIDKLLHIAETAALDAENTVIEFCSFAEKRYEQVGILEPLQLLMATCLLMVTGTSNRWMTTNKSPLLIWKPFRYG